MKIKPSNNQKVSDAILGCGLNVTYLKPNLVMYKILLDACQKSAELNKVLYWKGILENISKNNFQTYITY